MTHQTSLNESVSDSSMSKLSNSSGSECERDLEPPAAITNTRTILMCST